ncbi:HAD family hydrolase [Peptacetobacter hiranonis]|uniref:HAD family hydrolase n=1 Tax=Peptacetobacter hiranonis TaxID=89152 RepID=UPI0022E757F1|nr:HAD family hydrolase [Peptacetobacter hiranonis]
MSKVKIIFFDIDGTLIDMTKKAISDKTVDTLLRLKENGVKICIATGRAPGSVPKFDGVDFDAFLTFNGSYCFNSSDVILSTPIPKVDVEKMIENATKINRPVSIAGKDRVVANGTDKDLSDYFGFAKQEVPVSDDFDEVLKGEIYQMMMGGRKDEYDDILKDVENARITAWWDRAVDIIPVNGGKGKGIEAILEYYGIDRSESMAFGDGGNDIEMLQTVGTGVAMGNALDNVKAIADEICGTSAEDGIYHYCLENGLI